MVETPARSSAQGANAIHAVLIGGTAALFMGVLLADLAYSSTYEIQWKNFASWLLVGGLVLCGLTLLLVFVEAARRSPRERRSVLLVIILLATWILGFIDALIHAKDAWASMPAATIVSVITAALALAATWLVLTGSRRIAR